MHNSNNEKVNNIDVFKNNLPTMTTTISKATWGRVRIAISNRRVFIVLFVVLVSIYWLPSTSSFVGICQWTFPDIAASTSPSTSSPPTEGGRVFAFGDNAFSAAAMSHDAPTDHEPQLSDLLPPDLRFTSASSGYEFSGFLTDGGDVWMIGRNDRGQLGSGNTVDQLLHPVRPETIPPGAVTQLAVCDAFTLFLLRNGSVLGCGNNHDGQLGDGTNVDRSVPVLVRLIADVQRVSCGRHHSLFLRRDGSVWISGAIEFENWNRISRSVNSPVEISSLGRGNVINIACGEYHSLCVHADGTVSSFGFNEYGQLGDRMSRWDGGIHRIVRASVDDVVAVSGGAAHSLFLQRDGTVWASGYNGEGRLGDGTDRNRISPVRISSLSNDVVGIDASYLHSSFLHRDGSVTIFGIRKPRASSGDVDESVEDSFEPVVIRHSSKIFKLGSGWSRFFFIEK